MHTDFRRCNKFKELWIWQQIPPSIHLPRVARQPRWRHPSNHQEWWDNRINWAKILTVVFSLCFGQISEKHHRVWLEDLQLRRVQHSGVLCSRSRQNFGSIHFLPLQFGQRQADWHYPRRAQPRSAHFWIRWQVLQVVRPASRSYHW